MATIKERIDTVTESVTDGKQVIAGAITEKGVITSNNATFSTMANNIRAIETNDTLYSLFKTSVLDNLWGSTTYLSFSTSDYIAICNSNKNPVTFKWNNTEATRDAQDFGNIITTGNFTITPQSHPVCIIGIPTSSPASYFIDWLQPGKISRQYKSCILCF